MTHILENTFLHFSLAPERASWSLFSRQNEGLSLEEVGLRIAYRCKKDRFHALDDWQPCEFSSLQELFSAQGAIRQISLKTGPDSNGLLYTLQFALPEATPLFLWKIKIENHGPDAVQVDRLTMLQTASSWHFLRDNPKSEIRNQKSPLAFYSNGWQSWSYTGVYGARDRFRRTRLGPFRAPTDVNSGTPQPNGAGHFASDLFGVLGDRQRRVAVLAGFLSQRQHFGSLEAWTEPGYPALQLWANGDGASLNPGMQIETDWACLTFIQIDDPDPLGVYLDAVAREYGITPGLSASLLEKPSLRTTFSCEQGLRSKPEIPTGWCSWYQYSTDQYKGTITADDVRLNLSAMAKLHDRLPVEILQIDDGFEAQVGDWFSFSPAFPEGLAGLAAEIRTAGFTPGLWLAPFIVHPGSRLAADHPDWLLRGPQDRPVNAGFLWNSFSNALDLTHPDALAYASEVVHTAVHRWGFTYLKLDFLYAAALAGNYRDPTRTRAQVLRRGLEALRAAAGEEAYLLGCGCPLGPAIGLVDAMRISPDTCRRWQPAFSGIKYFFSTEPNLPSAQNALHNTLTRAGLHRRWWINDPDCLLLSRETKLTRAEVHSTATAIALTGGSLLLSDDLTRLTPDCLNIAEAMLPLIGRRGRVLDWFDSSRPQRLRVDLENATGAWHLLALFNWKDRPAGLPLHPKDFDLDPDQTYLAREFWSGRKMRICSQPEAGEAIILEDIPPHGVALLAVRPSTPGIPQYLGSNLHISQGLEVVEWKAENKLALRVERPGRARGEIEISLPQPPGLALLDGNLLTWKQSSPGCYLFPVQFDGSADLSIEYRQQP